MWSRCVIQRLTCINSVRPVIHRSIRCFSTASPPSVLLIDTSSLIFRAHHGFAGNPLTRSDGLEVSALYGLCNSLLMLIETLAPTHIACALDVASSRGERQLLLPDYKGNRVKDDNYNALVTQIKLVPNMLSGLGLKFVKHEGHEADDVIASLVEKISLHHPDAVIRIVSSDKDFTQILSDKPSVSLLKFKHAKSSKVVDAEGRTSDFLHFTAPMCKERYGIEIDQFVDYLALVGDVADNIPGVPKIGDKTAAMLLNAYGNLAGILEAARQGKLKREIISKSLLSNAEQVLIWRQVAKLNHGLEVPDLDALRFNGLQSVAPFMFKVFDEFHFNSLIDRLNSLLQKDVQVESEVSAVGFIGSKPTEVDSENTIDVEKKENIVVNPEPISSPPQTERRSVFVMDNAVDAEDEEELYIVMRSGHFK